MTLEETAATDAERIAVLEERVDRLLVLVVALFANSQLNQRLSKAQAEELRPLLDRFTAAALQEDVDIDAAAELKLLQEILAVLRPKARSGPPDLPVSP